MRPSAALRRILNHLTNDDFRAYHVYIALDCCILIRIKWIIKDETIRYPFELSFPETPRTLHPNDPTKIAICIGCKSHPNDQLSRRLASNTYMHRRRSIR